MYEFIKTQLLIGKQIFFQWKYLVKVWAGLIIVLWLGTSISARCFKWEQLFRIPIKNLTNLSNEIPILETDKKITFHNDGCPAQISLLGNTSTIILLILGLGEEGIVLLLLGLRTRTRNFFTHGVELRT